MFACHVACMHDSRYMQHAQFMLVVLAYNEPSHMHGLCGDGVNGVDGVDAVPGGVGGVGGRRGGVSGAPPPRRPEYL